MGNRGGYSSELFNLTSIVMAPKRNQLIEAVVVLLIWLMGFAMIFLLYLKFKIFFQK